MDYQNKAEAVLADSLAPEILSRRNTTSNDPSRSNPIVNHQLLEQLLDGLLICLGLHNDDIFCVSNQEMIMHSNIPSATYNYYYKSPIWILSEIYTEILAIVARSTKSCKDSKLAPVSAIHLLLNNLRLQPKMLKVLNKTDNVAVWQKTLFNFVKTYAIQWDVLPDNHWQFYYESYCFLFHQVLKKWSTIDYDDTHSPICDKLLTSALSSKTIFSSEIEDIFCKS